MAKKVSEQDQPLQSADKYYGNKDKRRSVIPRSIADSTLKHPNQLRPIRTPPAVDPRVPKPTGMRSADEYYASHDQKGAAIDVSQLGAGAVDASNPLQPIVIKNSNELRQKMARAIEFVSAGYAPVRVALGNKGLVSHARQIVDMAVTREEITEDQGRDIQFGLTPEAAGVDNVVDQEVEEKSPGAGAEGAERFAANFDEELKNLDESGAPIASDDEDDSDLDPAAFLAGEQDDDDEAHEAQASGQGSETHPVEHPQRVDTEADDEQQGSRIEPVDHPQRVETPVDDEPQGPRTEPVTEDDDSDDSDDSDDDDDSDAQDEQTAEQADSEEEEAEDNADDSDDEEADESDDEDEEEKEDD